MAVPEDAPAILPIGDDGWQCRSVARGVVFLGHRRCEVRDVPVRTLGHGEVRIRVRAAGICDADLHVYRRRDAILEVRGHEACGTVLETGPSVRRVQVGDRVLVHPHHGCGACYACLSGATERCTVRHEALGVHVPGAFADYLITQERNCVPLPPTATFVDGACMACTGASAYATLRQLGVVAHESLAIYGLDPLGLSCVLLAKALGLRVIGIDSCQHRLELARHCGIDAVLDANHDELAGAIRCFGRVAGWEWADGTAYVITTPASTTDPDVVLASLHRHGRAVALGQNAEDLLSHPSGMQTRAATLIRLGHIPISWLWDLAQLCAASGMSFAPIVTRTFPFVDAPEALRTVDHGVPGKVVFVNPEESALGVRASPL